MTAEADHLRVKALFDVAYELPEAQQLEALQRAGATEAELERVLGLLKRDRLARSRSAAGEGSHTTSGHGLGGAVAGMLGSLAVNDIVVGDRLGPWHIVAMLGEGGMGTVYKAERADGQFAQVSAIKVLAGLPTSEMLAYLARERQILASLSHPNIARLIDGGTTPHGNPYFAMDFVDGINIDQYCKQQKLGFVATVELFRVVCRAVEYAHQRLTLHCDLKPNNVMIDREGRPILLDFGIARWIDAKLDAAGGERFAAFTPRFASPEQRKGEPLGTASDVFSLGRMLAELVANQSIPRPLKAEFDAIITRATQEASVRRYASVDALESDLARLLAHQPITAVSHTWHYRLAKLLRRRWGVVTAGVLAFAVASGLVASIIAQRDRALLAENQARQDLARATRAEDAARAERDRAQAAEVRAVEGSVAVERASNVALQERDRAVRAEGAARRDADRAIRAEAKALIEGNTAKAVRDFLLGLFDNMHAANPGARKLTAYELLERGKERIETQLTDQPEVRSTVLEALGKIYDNIGDLENAKALYRKAIMLERDPKHGREEHLARLLARVALAESTDARPAVGEPLAREALAIRLKLFGENSWEVADSHGSMGLILSGLRKHAESREHLEKALSIREKLPNTPEKDIASALHNLGQHYALSGDYDKSVSLYQRAIDIKIRLFGEQNSNTFNSVEGLGMTLWRANRLAEAEPILTKLHASQLAINGPQSERLASASAALGNVLFDQGKYAAARAKFEQATAILGAPPLEQRGMRYSIYANDLAILLEEFGDVDAAEPVYREVLAVRTRLLNADNPLLARIKYSFGRFLLKRGQLGEAEALITEAQRIREKTLAPTDGEIIDSRLSIVELLLKKGDVAGARNAYDKIQLANNAPANRRIAYLRVGAQHHTARGEFALARDLAFERVSLTEKREGASHPRTALAQLDFAKTLARAGEVARAQALAASLQAPIAAAFSPLALLHRETKELLALPGSSAVKAP